MNKSRKMSKEVIKMIESVNNMLKFRKVTDESNELFIWACDYLLREKNMYHGFNFFREVDTYFNPLTGEVASAPTHVELTTPDKCEFLQLMIG